MGKFQVGNKIAKGRPLGSVNKRSLEFRAVLETSGFCPVTALIDGHKTALARFAEEIAKEDSGRISPMESSAAKYLKLAIDCASDLASYSYPKLKAVEQTKNDPLSGMTTAEKLEAMRQGAKFLESQLKAEKAVKE
jgi:hypothetical protein